jgi:hypothetical protein
MLMYMEFLLVCALFTARIQKANRKIAETPYIKLAATLWSLGRRVCLRFLV